MKSVTDGAGDNVVSFDAFKLARHGGARATSWTVAALTPWALAALNRYADTLPPHERPQWRRNEHTDRIIGVSFDTRRAALDFVASIELAEEVWA